MTTILWYFSAREAVTEKIKSIIKKQFAEEIAAKVSRKIEICNHLIFSLDLLIQLFLH